MRWLQLNGLPASTPCRSWLHQARVAAATMRCLVDNTFVPGGRARQVDDQCWEGSRASFNPGHVSRSHITFVSSNIALCSINVEASAMSTKHKRTEVEVVNMLGVIKFTVLSIFLHWRCELLHDRPMSFDICMFPFISILQIIAYSLSERHLCK